MFFLTNTITTIGQHIPDNAWPYLTGIVSAIAGGLVSLMATQAKNHTSTLLTNQQIIKEQLGHATKAQAEAARQQKAVTAWLSSQLIATKKELEKVSEASQRLKDELSALKIENARLIKRLETKDFD